MIHATIVMAIITPTVTVRKPKWRMMARLENQSGKPMICSPLVMMLAMPRAIDIIASVAMKAGMLSRVTIRPETSPQIPRNDQGDQDRDDERPAVVVAEVAHHHAGKRKHRADRKVDAADEDHQRHADSHHAEHRDLIHHVEEIAQREERCRSKTTGTSTERTRPISGSGCAAGNEIERAARRFRRDSAVAIALFLLPAKGSAIGLNPAVQ